MSNDSSASRDRILVHKMPAAENALSASTDAGGIGPTL